MIFTQSLAKDKLVLDKKPQRIVSLVPSVTETLLDIGVVPVGRTSFCIEPKDKVTNIPRVGGTKTLNINRIAKLNPDLIIANTEENTKEQIETLQSMNFHVWLTFPVTMQDVLEMLIEMGQLCSSKEAIEKKMDDFRLFLETPLPQTQLKVLILIWKDPWMAVGKKTYTDELLQFSGAVNVCAKPRYPIITPEVVQGWQPDVILLPTEPYAFQEKDQKIWSKLCPKATVTFFCGEDLFWSGFRTPKAAAELSKLIQSRR